jgi:hypothetical protein
LQKRESEKKSNGGLDFGGDLSDDFDSGDDEEEDSPPIEAVKPNTRKRKAAAISTTTTNNAPTQTASPPPVPAPTQTASSNNTQQPSAAASAAPTAPSTSSGSLSQYSSFVPTYDASYVMLTLLTLPALTNRHFTPLAQETALEGQFLGRLYVSLSSSFLLFLFFSAECASD